MSTTPASSISSTIDKLAESSVGRGLTTHDENLLPEQRCGQSDTFFQSVQRRLFNRFHILRSSPFRLGMLFWLLFTSCFGLGLYGFYETLQERMLSNIDNSLTVRYTHIQSVYKQEGLEEVIKVAETKSKSPMTSALGFYVAAADGHRVAGNVPHVVASEPGWNVFTGEQVGLDDHSKYRFLTGLVGDNKFSLGRSMDDLEELRHVALVCVLWMLGISTILSLGVALFVAQRVQKRMINISSAIDNVAAGNLLARLPITCAGDDIDMVSTKINASLDRLQLTVDGMRQVSTDIAHDLKTPLNRLYINLEDAATKSRSGQCVGDDLEVALDEANAINATFEALLRIAQIEAGARKAQFKPIDLKEVLETAAEVYTAVVEENDQSLLVDIRSGSDGKTLPLFGDKNLTMQLVVNLIENSVNHCKPGTQILISGGEDEQGVWFSVADSGPGIPEHERNKVFQRLYRLERSRTNKGTGLGLSMVKAIADLHGGVISLHDNEPGLVTKIRF